MNFEILKKAFPQFVINSLFALLFIFVIALISVLHTNATAFAADETKESVLDWTAADFIPKLMKQCSQLPPDALEIALKRAISAGEYRIELQESIERMIKRGSSADRARKSSKVMNFISPILANHPREKRAPRPPWDLPVSEWAEWYVEQNRIEAAKKQQFIIDLKCPQLPAYLADLAYKEALYPGTYLKKEK